MSIEFKDVEAAAGRIADGIARTPCVHSIPLSDLTGMQIYCKLEYLQRTGSFKERGARNALLQLSPEQKSRGVIAASAGNHALGLSYHGQLLRIPVTVVMPKFAPLTKVVNCRKFGATVILDGGNIGEAKTKADEIGSKRGLAYINGFDDLAIIAGQGTIGLEIASQAPDLDAVIVPIGGAGLVAGVALAVKKMRPNAQIIGVEPDRAASFMAAMVAGKPVDFDMKPTIADGLAVPKVGRNGFEIASKLVDRVLLLREHD